MPKIYVSQTVGARKLLGPAKSWLLILLGNHETKGTNDILHKVSAFMGNKNNLNIRNSKKIIMITKIPKE